MGCPHHSWRTVLPIDRNGLRPLLDCLAHWATTSNRGFDMGLDMYACKTLEQITQPVDFSIDNAELIQQWRKHPNLHGWMERLYREKGGKRPDFNCDTVLLTLQDLDRLEVDVKRDALPCTDGFFFGVTDGTEKEEDIMFIENARNAIKQGYQVFYDSWW
jgi:hypothetical protein